MRFRPRAAAEGARAVSLADSDALVDQILAWDNELFRKDLGPLPDRRSAMICGVPSGIFSICSGVYCAGSILRTAPSCMSVMTYR